MNPRVLGVLAALACGMALAAQESRTTPGAQSLTVQDAAAFLEKAEARLLQLSTEAGRAS